MGQRLKLSMNPPGHLIGIIPATARRYIHAHKTVEDPGCSEPLRIWYESIELPP